MKTSLCTQAASSRKQASILNSELNTKICFPKLYLYLQFTLKKGSSGAKKNHYMLLLATAGVSQIGSGELECMLRRWEVEKNKNNVSLPHKEFR